MARKLIRKMGVEVTACPTISMDEVDGSSYSAEYNSENTNCLLYRSLALILKSNKTPYFNCGTDPHVVEVSTKPYADRSKLMGVISEIREAMVEVGLTKASDWWTTGGGSHIHVTNHNEPLDRAVYFLMLKYWSAPWAFAHYSNSTCGIHNPASAIDDMVDDLYNRVIQDLPEYEEIQHDYYHGHGLWTTRSRRRRARINKLAKRQNISESSSIFDMFWDHQHNNPVMNSAYSHVIRKTHYGNRDTYTYTTEFRFFAATETNQQNIDHIDFVDALYAYAEKNLLQIEEWARSMTVGEYIKMMRGRKSRKSINENFRSCLRSLGLDLGRYSQYRDNLNLRISFSMQNDNKNGNHAILC